MSINSINELNYENLSIRLEVTFCVWCFIRLHSYLIKIPVLLHNTKAVYRMVGYSENCNDIYQEDFPMNSISLKLCSWFDNSVRNYSEISYGIRFWLVYGVATWEIEIFSDMTAIFSKYIAIITTEVFRLAMSIK